METVSYKRKRGSQLIYEITYDEHGYEVRRDGDLKMAWRTVPQVAYPISMDQRRREDMSLDFAKRDVEGLVAMDE